MSKQERTTPEIVLVTGLPGTGKTTLGRQISSELAMPYIGKDVIKELMFDELGWSDREWSRRIGGATLAIIDYLVEEEMRAGHSVVLEGNFKPDRDDAKYSDLQQKYGVHVVQLLCHANGDVLFDRFRHRAENGERHPGHVDAENLKEWRHTFSVDRSVPLNIPSEVISVDTTDFSILDVQKVVDDLRYALQK